MCRTSHESGDVYSNHAPVKLVNHTIVFTSCMLAIFFVKYFQWNSSYCIVVGNHDGQSIQLRGHP